MKNTRTISPRALDDRTDALLEDDEVALQSDIECDRSREATARVAQMPRRLFPALYLVSHALAPARRRAVLAFAMFIRAADVESEREGEGADERWRRWCERALAAEPPVEDDILLAFAAARRRYGIPRAWVQAQLAGLKPNLEVHRSFDDLASYCHHTLAPAGLIMTRLLGADVRAAGHEAARFAMAVQMSDVLRDLDEDLNEGRNLLPIDELAVRGVDVEQVRRAGSTEGWRAVMRRALAANRRLYETAEAGVARLPLAGALAAAMLGALYLKQLEDIEGADFDVFRRPPRLRARHLLAAGAAALRVLLSRVARRATPRVWAWPGRDTARESTVDAFGAS